jgi:hypothetical protein
VDAMILQFGFYNFRNWSLNIKPGLSATIHPDRDTDGMQIDFHRWISNRVSNPGSKEDVSFFTMDFSD